MMTTNLAIQTCSVQGCAITATESGMCFYHDRCPPEEVTPTVAARVLRETRMKTEIKHTVTQESVTIVQESENIIRAGEPSLCEKSLETYRDWIHSKMATAISTLSLQSGGEVSIWLDFNPFSASVEDRAFVEDVVSFIQAYARKHPMVPKKKDD